jgi:hypothetical protein
MSVTFGRRARSLFFLNTNIAHSLQSSSDDSNIQRRPIPTFSIYSMIHEFSGFLFPIVYISLTQQCGWCHCLQCLIFQRKINHECQEENGSIIPNPTDGIGPAWLVRTWTPNKGISCLLMSNHCKPGYHFAPESCIPLWSSQIKEYAIYTVSGIGLNR